VRAGWESAELSGLGAAAARDGQEIALVIAIALIAQLRSLAVAFAPPYGMSGGQGVTCNAQIGSPMDAGDDDYHLYRQWSLRGLGPEIVSTILPPRGAVVETISSDFSSHSRREYNPVFITADRPPDRPASVRPVGPCAPHA